MREGIIKKITIGMSFALMISGVNALSYKNASSKFSEWIDSTDKAKIEEGLTSFLGDYANTDYFKKIDEAIGSLNEDNSVCSDGVECIGESNDVGIIKECDENKNCTIKFKTGDKQIKDDDDRTTFEYDNDDKKISYVPKKGTDGSILGNDIIDLTLIENFLQTAVNELGISSDKDLKNFKTWLANNKDVIGIDLDDKWLNKLAEIDIDKIIDEIDVDTLKNKLGDLSDLQADPGLAEFWNAINENLKCENTEGCESISLYEILQDEKFREYIGWVYEIDKKLGNQKASTALTKLIKAIYNAYENSLNIKDEISDKSLKEIIGIIQSKYENLSPDEIKALATSLKTAIEGWLDELKDSDEKDFLDLKRLKNSLVGKIEDSELQEWLTGQLAVLKEYGLDKFLSDEDFKKLLDKVIVPALRNSSSDLSDAVESLLKNLKINKFQIDMKKLASYDNSKDYAEIYSDKNVDVDNTGKNNYFIYFAVALILLGTVSTVLYIRNKRYL